MGSEEKLTGSNMIVPEAGNPRAWDRYGYVYNLPIGNDNPSRALPFFLDNWWIGYWCVERTTKVWQFNTESGLYFLP